MWSERKLWIKKTTRWRKCWASFAMHAWTSSTSRTTYK